MKNALAPKVLMVTTIPDTIRGFLLPFADHFRAKGFRVDALARGIAESPECVRAFDRVWDVNWSRNPLDPRNLWHAPDRVRRLVVEEHYDIVHVHTPVAAFVTRFGLRDLPPTDRPTVIYTAHGFHFYQGGPRLRCAVFRTLERWAGRWTDYLVVMNREDEQAAARYRLVPFDRVRFMPGIGVDTEAYRRERVAPATLAGVRQELGLAGDDRLFLMVAEFIARKRHRDSIAALARLPLPWPGRPVLAFAGTGPLEAEMKRLAESLGVADRVRFLGFRSDIPTLLQASAATLLPSAQEGLPRSVMESLCLGVPVIGSRIRGTVDLLDHGCGLTVPVGDVDGLAKAMTWILEHPEEASAMGRRGREKMKDYDLRHIIRLHDDLYSEVLDRSGRVSTVPNHQAAGRRLRLVAGEVRQ